MASPTYSISYWAPPPENVGDPAPPMWLDTWLGKIR